MEEFKNTSKFEEWKKFAEDNDSDLLENLLILTKIEQKQLFGDTPLQFGTAGVRSKVGLGPTLLNNYNVYRLGCAYAATMSDELKEKGVVVFHDTRNHSEEFSNTLISAFVDSGVFKVWKTQDNKAIITPAISYVIRKLNLGGGIMVTASHNPPEYQGMKFYDAAGIQVSDSFAKEIEQKYVEKGLTKIKNLEKDERVQAISNEVLNSYFGMVQKQYNGEKISKKHQAKVLLTTLQGASAPYVTRIKDLLKLNIDFVESEKKPDPSFKVAQSTNPENFDKAYNNALSVAFEKDYDVLLAIDPDGDRLGVFDIKEMRKRIENNTLEFSLEKEEGSISDFVGEDKEWCLSGNKVSALFMDQKLHELEEGKKDDKNKKKNKFIVRSHVTSNCVDYMAKEHDIEVKTTFTGFKWIGRTVNEEIEKGNSLLMAFEESIGYFFSSKIREKDSLQALITIINLIERLNKEADKRPSKQALTLTEHLGVLFNKYGYFLDKTDNIPVKITKPQFKELVNKIRTSEVMSRGDMTVEEINHPTTNELSILVLKFPKDEGWIAIRPSGTEPKVKVYYVLRGENINRDLVWEKYEKTSEVVTRTIKNFIQSKIS